jgi:hypothetical protein
LKTKKQKSEPIKAYEIKQALALKYTPGEWCFMEEMPFGTGFGSGSDNRIDAWAMNLWPSSGLKRHAFEIKVSRADFKHEMKRPQKHANALKYSHFFWFVTPKGLLKPHEIPPYAGLMEVERIPKPQWSRFKFYETIKAPGHECAEPPWHFVAAIARCLEKRTTVPKLHDEIHRLKNDISIMKMRVKHVWASLFGYPNSWEWE